MDSAALIAAVASVALTPAHAATAPEALQNWFHDPYFAVSTAIPACPVPRGPYQTKVQMEREAHVRVERGTRCFQEGKCRLPNSYHYDPEIADNLRIALEKSPALRGTSLWVTVQRRWIFIQGCVDATSKRATLEKIARAIPDVENVFVDVTTDPRRLPPYFVLEPTPERR